MSNNINETKHKDNLFQLIFGENKENALSLYNAVNGTHYTNADNLIYQKVDSGVFTKMEHDVGFMFDRSLNLYEHQSTINPNMPLRGFFYYSDMYRQIIPNHSRLYGKSIVKIDNPKFIVFYNGKESTKEDIIKLKLSDAFNEADSSGDYEWTAIMININAGHNEGLKKACKVLNDYSILIDKIKEYRCTMELHDAIIKAVVECIKAGVLADILEKYQEVILTKIINDFTEEEFHMMLRNEAFEEGVDFGIEQGIKRMLDRGKTAEEIAEFCGYDIKKVLDVLASRRG